MLIFQPDQLRPKEDRMTMRRFGRVVETLAAVNTNHEGFPTFKHSLRDQVRNYLRTGTLSGTFYVGAVQIARETIDTLCRFGEQDAAALSEEAIAAREDGFMRTLPILATVVLSGLPNKQLFLETASRVLKIPRDVAQFIEICKSGAVPNAGKFGGCRVQPVRKWLENISEYHAVKGSGLASMSLRDAVRLAHPHPRDAQMQELLGWLSGHVEGKSVSQNEMVVALERLKRTTDIAEQVRLIRGGRLSFEAVTAAVNSPSPEVWTELLKNAPTFNLLRNLRTFTRHGVFKDGMNVEIACEKLSQPDAMRRARILPFRAYQAWKAYSQEESADSRIIAALSDALTHSVANMPLFGGRVCIAPDVSGSMGCVVTSGGTLTCAEVAGIFAAGLFQQCPNVTVLPFEHEVVRIALNPRDSVITNAQVISSLGGGGTSLSAPVEKLIREQDKVDLFVGLTDNEEWVGRGFVDAWRQYVAEVSPDAKAVLITVVPSPHRVVPESESGVHYVHGWSDSVMRYVSEIGGVVMSDEADDDV